MFLRNRKENLTQLNFGKMTKDELDDLYNKYKEMMDAKIAQLRETSDRAFRLSHSSPFGGETPTDWSLVAVALNSHNEMLSAVDALQVQTKIYKDKLSEFEK